MLNYKEILDELDSEKVKTLLEKLDIPYVEHDTYIVMPTACHNEDLSDASWKLYFYKDSNIFFCYTEDGAMNAFKFLENYYMARDIKFNWYKDVFLVIKDCSNYRGDFEQAEVYKGIRDKYKKNDTYILDTYDNKILESFIKYYPDEWLDDGISKEAMDKFNILYSISQNKIIIPHYDYKGNLVGIRGRALNKEEAEKYGKYMPVTIENHMYNHKLSFNLYGLYENKNNISEYGICFVFEGEKSVLQMESFNFPNCSVAVCGSKFNIHQLKLIKKVCNPKEIVICFDKEELKGEDKYFNKLYEMCKKYKNYCNMSFIYDRENLLKLKDSPTDNGEETFNKLIKRRVKI